ncbi:DUF2334 domain-containing protein [Thalassobacillus devorans]|uniref:DUF2334 domain-containing protein n=1 Tax=Thalassobacillus devorans TaxID=279813 RepID=UPI000A1CD8D6|nr:DUF2334 domain-containing protein [Thalassobacillus devorans]
MNKRSILGYGGFVCLFVLLIVWISTSSSVNANTSQEPLITVVYSAPDNKVGEHERRLDMLLSHFSQQVHFVNVQNLKENELIDTTHLFYFGQIKENLPDNTIELINRYQGVKVAIGYNHEQLNDFSFVKMNNTAIINELSLPSSEESITLPEKHQIFNITGSDTSHTWITAESDDQSFPLFIQNQSNYYFADNNLSLQDTILLGEVLHEILNVPHQDVHPAAMRLEDVNPLLDPKLLRDSADVLLKRNIPFMISVTPVYKDPSTGENYYLSESPGLANVLQDLREAGATIILHGYTDQTDVGKSGDGFEFWNPAKSLSSDLTEKGYIQARIKQGIIELQKNGLEVYAFETPHYTISQEGYEAVAEFFETYIGQVQLTDNNWRVMEESPFLTSPGFIHGMRLVPETLRYIQDGEPDSVNEVVERAEQLSLARDSVMSAFYHPYLGADGLIDMLDKIETISNLEWIDLAASSKPAPILAEKNEAIVQSEDPSQLNSLSVMDRISLMYFPWLALSLGGAVTALMILASYYMTLKVKREE